MEKDQSERRLEYDIVDVKNVKVADIRATAKAAWKDLKRDGSKSQKDAKAAGIDLEAMPSSFEEALSIEQTSAGIVDPASLSIIVLAAAPIVNRVVTDIWKEVILPRISERWGKGAIKAKHEEVKAVTKQVAAAAKKAKAPAAAKTSASKKSTG